MSLRCLLPLLAISALHAAQGPSRDPAKSPTESLAAMKPSPGMVVQLVASEPAITQPVGYTIDERGRIWLIENTNYPNCPGEKKDRLLILEDTHGDGKADKIMVVTDQLTYTTGIALGFGGVFLGSPPNLLFLPIKDDKPAGQPQILLDGWGSKDTHECLNSFSWGPDGWLYGTQGVFTPSRVGAPGTPDDQRVALDAAVWRYHPVKKRFETFATGGSNQWGVDWNDRGQCFFTACVIPHLWHCIQGGRYQRQGGRHPRYTYDDLKTIGDQPKSRAFCGSCLYLGGLFPAEYRDSIIYNSIHENVLHREILTRSGATFTAKRPGEPFLTPNDTWFMGLSLQYGPDGALYCNDWYDKAHCHQQRGMTDRSNGRFWKITLPGTKPVQVDLARASDEDLVKYQADANEWYVRMSRRLLQQRGPKPEVHAALKAQFEQQADEGRKLRSLWCLHACGGLDEAFGLKLLDHPLEYVRAWTIQLLLEDGKASAPLLARLAALAAKDPSPVVRCYLASGMQRLPAADRWAVVEALAARAEDAEDKAIPLLLYWAAEVLVPVDGVRAAKLLETTKLPKFREQLARRIAEK